MRMTDIKVGERYAATGREFQIARVRVRRTNSNISSFGPIEVEVEEGDVYQGWGKNLRGALDMSYASPGQVAYLTPRAILRTWRDEMMHRVEVLEQREHIRETLSEMDRLLTDMELPSAQVHLVQIPEGPIAVAVLGIEEVRAIHEQLWRARPSRPEME